MTAPREVAQGRQVQGEDEQIVYRITTTPWGTVPSNVSVVVKDVSASYSDVTAAVMTGNPSIAGDVITLPKLKALTAKHIYRVEVKFDAEGNTFEAYFEVRAQR
jgi:Na+-translocating ferredoxin:NAD+ oxidoreductase RnfC subunit